MVITLPYPPPLFMAGVLHRHPGEQRELAAIPIPYPFSIFLVVLVTYIETVTGRAHIGAYTARHAFPRYPFPILLVFKVGSHLFL